MTTLIDKIALIHLRDGQILSTRSRGKDVYYLPGGKREAGESDLDTLVREVSEELAVSSTPGLPFTSALSRPRRTVTRRGRWCG